MKGRIQALRSYLERKDQPNRNFLAWAFYGIGMTTAVIMLMVVWCNHPIVRDAIRRPPPNKTWALIEFDSPILRLPEDGRVLRVRYGNEIEPVSGGLPYPPNPPMSKLSPNLPAPPTSPPPPAPPVSPPTPAPVAPPPPPAE